MQSVSWTADLRRVRTQIRTASQVEVTREAATKALIGSDAVSPDRRLRNGRSCRFIAMWCDSLRLSLGLQDSVVMSRVWFDLPICGGNDKRTRDAVRAGSHFRWTIPGRTGDVFLRAVAGRARNLLDHLCIGRADEVMFDDRRTTAAVLEERRTSGPRLTATHSPVVVRLIDIAERCRNVVEFSSDGVSHADQCCDESQHHDRRDEDEFRGNDETGFVSPQGCQQASHDGSPWSP